METTLHVAHQQLSPDLESGLSEAPAATGAAAQLQDGMASIMQKETPREILLISVVAKEQSLYNPKHEHYRNTQRKDAKWVEIAERVGWTETQCKAKWKAMRDQYCRELKRSKFNVKANVKWKYFKELDFLRPYALSRNYRPRNIVSTALAGLTTSAALNSNSNQHPQHNNLHQNVFSSAADALNNGNKYPIKIEAGHFSPIEFSSNVTAGNVDIKTEANGLISSLTEEHLNVIQQHHFQQKDTEVVANWSYLTTTTASNNDAGDNQGNGNNLAVNSASNNNSAEDMLYGVTNFMDCVVEIQGATGQQAQLLSEQQQHVNQQQQVAATSLDDADDDDVSIHTFLNYETFFEKELIALIQQEEILYNSYHSSYRNVKLKLEVWEKIANKLKKTTKTCRLKWKALRDQYIREHKRLKNRENAELLPRWKHYDALNFLQKYIRQKSSDFDNKTIIQLAPNAVDSTVIDDNIMSAESPLHSPMQNAVDQNQHHLLIHTNLPSLTGPHSAGQQHQMNEHQNTTCGTVSSICVVNANSVGEYDEMDIDNYIIGDASSDDGGVAADEQDDVDNLDEDDDEDDEENMQHNQLKIKTSNQLHHHFEFGTNNHLESQATHTILTNPQHQLQHHIHAENVVITTHNHIQSNAGQQQHQRLELQEEDLHDDEEFSDIKPHASHEVVISHNSNALTKTASTTTTTSLTTQQHQQFQQAHVCMSLDEAISQHQQQQDFKAELQQNACNHSGNANNSSLLNGNSLNDSLLNSVGALSSGVSTSVATSSSTCIMLPVSLASNTTASATVPNINSAPISSTNIVSSQSHEDDDEVGAFFKAVAMKIRNAKMSPVAFTDLQIDILRVINGTLRNH